jgi:hypothetical protein
MSTMTETMTPTGAEFAQLDEARLADVVRKAVGAGTDETVEILSQGLETVAYEIGTISTCALLRAFGEARVDGVPRTWSAFVKVLQSARVWPMIQFIPEEQREKFLADFPWRLEIDAQQSPLREVLPDGLRLADLYAVDEIDDDHATLWMEDVPPSQEPWGTDRFVRAARLLGALAARRPVGTDAVFGDLRYARDPGCALRLYVEGRVHTWAGPALHDDAIWSHPAMAETLEDLGEADRTSGLRAVLCHAYSLVPELFSVVEALPQTHAHGDASPQNLLVHADAPDEFVAIDWGFNCPVAVGFDLGQLLVGLVHAGELEVSALGGLHDLVVPAYAEGLRAGGFEASDRAILTGHVGSTMLRSGFTALPFEAFQRSDIEDSPALRAHLAERIRLTRFMLDLTQSTLPDVWG